MPTDRFKNAARLAKKLCDELNTIAPKKFQLEIDTPNEDAHIVPAKRGIIDVLTSTNIAIIAK